MNKIFGSPFVFLLLIACTPLAGQEKQAHGTIVITTTPTNYTTWKLKRAIMQLKREHNSVAINSLLQPAAALGSVFFSTAVVILTIGVLSGGGRDTMKDLIHSIDAVISLIKAPFTLQYEKNKALDRIAELNEELAKRPAEII